jgi:hypothetical protein
MVAPPTPLTLVVVVGPQASGKSALSRALCPELRQDDELVALVELDQIAAMALPTLPNWEVARDIFAATTGMWARTALTCVVAEGVGTQDEVSSLLSQAPADALTVTVVTTVPFDVAYARAQTDPTRGISREHRFLSAVYDRWSAELPRVRADVLIDTSASTIGEGVDRIRAAIQSARRSRSDTRYYRYPAH